MHYLNQNQVNQVDEPILQFDTEIVFILIVITRMISKEEFSVLQEKLLSLSNQKDDLESKLKEEEERKQKIPELRAKVDQLRKQIEEEEERQMKELADATRELHSLHSGKPDGTKKTIMAEQNKIPKLESQLATAKEKHERISKQLVEYRTTNEANEAQKKPVIEQIEKLETRVEKINKLKVRMPRSSPILLQLEDLENTTKMLEESIRETESEIPKVESEVDAAQSKNSLDLAELRRLNADSEAIVLETNQMKAEIDKLFENLEGLSSALQATNVSIKTEMDRRNIEKKQNDELALKTREETGQLLKKWTECAADMDCFPKYIKVAQDEISTRFAKKKSMAEQLEKKLDDVHQELILKQQDLPIVKELTVELEKQWVLHQKVFDRFTKAENELNRKKEDLERKQMAIEEINRKWPANGKVKSGKKGMAELEYIYEDAMIQNRKMAGDLGTITEELAVHEEMNRTLKAALEKSKK